MTMKKIESAFDKIEGFLLINFMAIAITLTFVQVVLRYGFNAPLYWVEEVVLYSIICMSFIGISYGVKYQIHISVEVLKALIPAKFSRPLAVTTSILGLVFGLTLLYLGWKLTSLTFSRGQLSPALRIPIAWIYLVIPISGASTVFRYSLECARAYRGTTSKELNDELNLT